MGITGFHDWIRTYHNNVFIPTTGNTVWDYIYVDVNHILHKALYRSNDKEVYIDKVIEAIKGLTRNWCARKEWIFAIDGASPYAKVILQRLRRLQTAQSGKVQDYKLSALHLTPGSPVLQNVEKNIINWMDEFINSLGILKTKYSIIGHRKAGEGELKIVHQMKLCYLGDTSASHLLISNDADMIAMTAAIHPIKNIAVFTSKEIISIDALVKNIWNKCNWSYFKPKWFNESIDQSESTRNDICVLSIMGGNDYIPKVGYTTIPKLFNAYYNYRKADHHGFTDENGISKERFIKYLLFVNKNMMKNNQVFKMDNNTVIFDDARIEDYLEGLQWCLEMYRTGICPKQDWAYTSSGVILPIHIIVYLLTHDIPKIPRSDAKPIPHKVYPLLTLPSSAKDLIHTDLHKYMNKDHMKDMYSHENCEKCISYRHKITKINGDITNMKNRINDAIDNDEDEGILDSLNKGRMMLQKKLQTNREIYKNHKEEHENSFSIDLLRTILKDTEDFI